MKSRPSLALLLLLLLPLLQGACSLPFSTQRGAAPAIHTYLLEWQPAGNTRPVSALSSVLLIGPTRAAAGYGGSDLLYSNGGYELSRFAYHRWVEAPARMLEPLLQAAGEHSGRFSAVITAGSPARAGLRLDTTLLRLRQVFTPDGSHVELAVSAGLFDVAGERLLANRRFSYTEPCAADTPMAGVEAANRGLARFLGELQQFLIEAMAGWQPSASGSAPVRAQALALHRLEPESSFPLIARSAPAPAQR